MANKNETPTEIKKEEMINALKRSGYLIEQRIYPILERLSYYFETNPIYEDPEQHKSREIDFKARRLLENKDVEIEYILFGECINNPNPIVFFSNKVIADLVYRELSLTFTGLPMAYPNEKNKISLLMLEDNRIPLSKLLKLHSSHHYFHGFPSTQYCSFQYKRDLKEWMASHDQNHHEDFDKLINSIIFERKKILSYPSKVAKNEDIIPLKNIVFYYPIIVLAGEMFECNQQLNNTPILNKTNHIKYKKPCIINNDEANFIIDVIKESYLENYLKMIHEEHSQILNEITKNITVIKKEIDCEKPARVESFHNSVFGKDKF